MVAPAYVVVQMNISDMERYKEYMAAAPATIKEAGGEYLVRGGRSESLEGNWKPHRLAVLKFPSYDEAKAWAQGENYRRAREKRLGATDYFDAVVVEGVDASPT